MAAGKFERLPSQKPFRVITDVRAKRLSTHRKPHAFPAARTNDSNVSGDQGEALIAQFSDRR